MTTASFFVSANNHVVRSVHKQHFVILIFFVHVVENLNKVVKKFATARVDDENHFVEMPRGVRAQFDEFRNKNGRQIVHTKIAQVFEVSASLSFAAAAHARDNYNPRFVGEFARLGFVLSVESFNFHKKSPCRARHTI